MMRDAPLAAPLSDEHRIAAWRGYWIAVLHPGEFVEPSNQYSIVVDCDHVAFLYCILVSAVFDRSKVFQDRIVTDRDDWTYRAKKDCIRPVFVGYGFGVIRSVRRRPLIEQRICVFRLTGGSYAGRQKPKQHRDEPPITRNRHFPAFRPTLAR